MHFAPDKCNMAFSPMSLGSSTNKKVTPTISYRMGNKNLEETAESQIIQQMYEDFKNGVGVADS